MEQIEVIIGTYEKLILGYRFVSITNGSYSLEASFTEDSHIGSLRCLNVSQSGTLASSSTDDSVRLHSLVKRKDIGQLFQHDGAVNCITFYKRSHMFTASEDGTICMWKTRNWEMIRCLKGHKAYVTAVAVHPSGKLGLSVGSDRSLLTWDFITGKLAFQRKIKEAALNILFTSSGSHYILVYQKRIEICSLDDTKTVQEIPTNWRINAMCMVKDQILAVAGDDRHVLLVDVLTGKQMLTLDMAKPGEDTFNGRVRCLRVVVCEGQTLVVAATANGNIKIFKVNLSENVADVVLFYEARVRVTCMAVHNFGADSHKEEEESGAKEPSQVKKPGSKAHKKNLGVETNKISAEVEQADDDEVEENKDLDTNTSRTGRKRQRQQPTQQPSKKRKLQSTGAEKTGIDSSKKKVQKSSSPSKTPQVPARQSKKLKIKKKKKMKLSAK